MKVALLSDIHGNAYALSNVLNELQALKVDRIIVSGDFVDYYYSPDLVFQLLRHWKIDAILGNHDKYLLELKNDPAKLPYYTRKYGHGLSEALNKLSTEDWNFLESLTETKEIEINTQKFFICHGSPLENDEYIYPDTGKDQLEKITAEIPNDTIIISGHSHYPFITLLSGSKTFINPGSVGQSRQRGGFASWVLCDLSNNSFAFHSTPYDVGPLKKEVMEKDPGLNYLSKVLSRTIL